MVLFLVACAPSTAPLDSDEPSAPPPDFEDISASMEAVRVGVPALGGAIVGPEGVIAMGVTGRRRNGSPELVTLDDPFHLGSETKAMTATLLAVAVEQGTISWETTVTDVWPAADSGWASVTLHDLITHRGGAPAVPPDHLWIELYNRSGQSDSATRQWFATELLADPPGTVGAYAYSNAGYMLAGAMLEDVSGRDWESAMRADLFEPLGMEGCGFGPPTGDAPWGHAAAEPVDPTALGSDNPPALGPAGTVHCPMAGWAAFLRAHLTDDPSLLDAASWDLLHTPPAGDYAGGWGIVNQGWTNGDAYTHDGSNTMWYASTWVVPGLDRAYLSVTNRGDANGATAATDAIVALLER